MADSLPRRAAESAAVLFNAGAGFQRPRVAGMVPACQVRVNWPGCRPKAFNRVSETRPKSSYSSRRRVSGEGRFEVAIAVDSHDSKLPPEHTCRRKRVAQHLLAR